GKGEKVDKQSICDMDVAAKPPGRIHGVFVFNLLSLTCRQTLQTTYDPAAKIPSGPATRPFRQLTIQQQKSHP
ncbi:hypothetical protein, partial [Erwinia sp.]|uniref:hypothetical protein n=1 Tax=Erwinia citreus TaxID=558 RepID=UPI003C79555B